MNFCTMPILTVLYIVSQIQTINCYLQDCSSQLNWYKIYYNIRMSHMILPVSWSQTSFPVHGVETLTAYLFPAFLHTLPWFPPVYTVTLPNSENHLRSEKEIQNRIQGIFPIHILMSTKTLLTSGGLGLSQDKGPTAKH